MMESFYFYFLQMKLDEAIFLDIQSDLQWQTNLVMNPLFSWTKILDIFYPYFDCLNPKSMTKKFQTITKFPLQLQ